MTRSLRLRLALWCGTLLCASAIMIAAWSYAVHSRTHYDEADAALTRLARYLRAEIANATDSLTDRRALDAARALGARAWIVNVGATGAPRLLAGDSLQSVPWLAPEALHALHSAPAYPPWVGAVTPPMTHHAALVSARAGARGATLAVLRDPSGERWRVLVAPLTGPRRGELAVLMPLDELDAAVRHVGMLLMTMAVAGTALAFSAAWLLAGHGLRPVATMTRTAHAIARSGSFAERVPAGARGDELGLLADTLNAMLERLEQVHAAQQRFLADASHELRAPLTVIAGNLELLRHRTRMSGLEQEAAIEEAHVEAARLTRLVTDLLVLARANAGVPLRRAPLDLDHVLIEAVNETRHLAPDLEVTITRIEPAPMSGDADRLKQLLLILLDNAVKYTRAPGQVSASLESESHSYHIAIRDSGIGIDASDLPHVFDRFFRADPARSRDSGGSGLGLAIASAIVAQHGGSIRIESAPGQGTAVLVDLPRATEPTTTHLPTSP